MTWYDKWYDMMRYDMIWYEIHTEMHVSSIYINISIYYIQAAEDNIRWKCQTVPLKWEQFATNLL